MSPTPAPLLYLFASLIHAMLLKEPIMYYASAFSFHHRPFMIHHPCSSMQHQQHQQHQKQKQPLLPPLPPPSSSQTTIPTALMAQKEGKQISQQRRNQLGIPDNADEYDLDEALNQNTDPLITKVIAGSFIVVVIALLVAGIVIPSLTDYGEGVCSPIQNGGRC